MITLIIGENAYERDQAVAKIIADTDAVVERYHGNEMTQAELAQIAHGISLFNDKKIVIIRDMGQNKDVWDFFGTISQDIASETHIVVVEPKPDKRTKTFKLLQKQATVVECREWGERDIGRAEQWLLALAKKRDVSLERAAAHAIVQRRGVDQYQLLNTLTQIAVLGDISVEVVEKYIETTPQENVFKLLEAALEGDARNLHAMIQSLRHTNDPYMTLGLLVSQVFSLSGLVLTNESTQDLASRLQINPFVLRNLSHAAKSVDAARVRALVLALAEADMALKSTTADPWLQIEIALIKL